MVCWIARALVGDVPTLWPIRARRAQSDPKVYSSAAAGDGDSVGRARPGLVTAVRQRDSLLHDGGSRVPRAASVIVDRDGA